MRLAAAALLGTLLLSGCAAPPRGPEVGGRPDAATLREWTANGRLALASDGEGGSGSFVWRQREDLTELGIRGPLGAGALEIVASPGSFAVVDGSGASVDPQAARAYLQSRLGADVPWESLRYWMLGVPAPESPSRVSESGAAPWRIIEQAGWTIGYDAFATTAYGSLPRRFTATREAIRVKVIVDDWSVPDSGGRPTTNGVP